jgi:toxin ParE1/3/4
MRVIFAPSARNDLLEIGDYIAADNPSAAKRLVAELKERADRLKAAPRSGRPRPELQAGLRSIAFHSYVIFYRIQDTTVRIERILHGARDVDTMLGDKT